MPNFKHVVSSEYKPTFRTEKVKGMFDLDVNGVTRKEWDVKFPIENVKDWKIGLIVGASGTGKTTLSKQVFDEDNYHHGFEWRESSLLDDFSDDLSVREITSALSSVGFSSPPSWMLPYGVLSNGQKFRAEVARSMLEGGDLVVFDEFTSVVDRNVAKVGSYAVQKFIRKSEKQFVAVTCHYDVEEWLMPDWVYDVSTGEFRTGRLERRPEIKCEIQQCDKSVWKLFKEHHYLTHSITSAAKWFVLTINEEPAAVTSIFSFPNRYAKHGRVMRGHRTVVLPDYQGIGLANILVESIAQYVLDSDLKFQTTTSHPAMIAHRLKSTAWKTTRKPSRSSGKTGLKGKAKSNSGARITASFEYIG